MVPFSSDKPGEISALFQKFPWVGEAAGVSEVSCVYVGLPDEMPGFHWDTDAMGYNTSGIFIIRDAGGYTRSVTWDEAHAHRKENGLKEEFLNSPQTEITPLDTALLSVHNHADDHDTVFKGISMDMFLCPLGKQFKDYKNVVAWLAELGVLYKLRQVGIVP